MATIGFFKTLYSAIETDGHLNIQVGVTSGLLQRVVVVNLLINSNVNGSGKYESYYRHMSTFDLW